MAASVYVVCENGWEYNDEYYYQGENGGVNLTRAFRSKENADADCLTRNVVRLRELWAAESLRRGIAEYTDSGWEGLVNESDLEDLFKLLNKHGIEALSEDDVEFKNPDDPLPDAFFVELLALMTLTFYVVVEVEADL